MDITIIIVVIPVMRQVLYQAVWLVEPFFLAFFLFYFYYSSMLQLKT